MSHGIFHPNYRIVIDTPEKARLYNKLLVAKIVVATILLSGLLYASGYNLPQLAAVIAGVALWKFVSKRLSRQG